MLLKDINEYVENRNSHLTKFSFDAETDEMNNYYVVKTKETYVFEDEYDADKLINEARQDLGFAGCDKKYKAGKMNKAGEVVKAETWTVTIKLNH